MNLNEAKELLENAGYIVENTISFKQEAENIVYSYGTDEYGLDVYQIVNIMEDASEIKGRYEQTDFITNQIKKITGLSIWDIENDENLQAAHFDICNAVYKKTSQRKQNDNLGETKKILKNAGYIVESKVATKEDFDNLFKLCGFEKTNGKFDWIKKVYQRYGKGYLKAIIGQDYCKIVYFRFDPTLHWDDEKCYELNDSYKVSFDTEDAIALLRDYIMDYDQE